MDQITVLDTPKPPAAQCMPDPPRSFGYKMSWFAVSADDSRAVADALGMCGLTPASWEAGVAAAYGDSVFVTPSIAGWVLAAGFGLGQSADEEGFTWLRLLSARFGEAQFFSTHRVVEYHAWARAVGGTLTRAYCSCGEQGEVYWSSGTPLPDEPDLGADGFADEQDVMAVAGRWSVDPTLLDRMGLPPSSGFTGRLSHKDA